ncbi:bile acid:sodium symporter family protein [Pseudomonas sp. ADAK13]|uniref:bile acid:sodium symporter family protein n=1 Tax=Pseudomonas sp. ADAK13 TaxID=2730847 RepID=UPI001463E6DB|nr:bile acid:sodium symporter family protein [Pseudomonas sp. ADAK13]QJI37123.1 bile acid:sodium symporter family protein [Pseudomonas sp. ADAK13]
MEQSVLIEIGLPAALFIIMAGMGMTLVPSDFYRVASSPKALIWGSVAALLLLPIVGILLAMLLRLPPEIAVGLVIIAACPIGTTSNLISFLARGKLALSIAMTVVGSLATIVTLPLFVNFALERFVDADTRVYLPVLETISMLVCIVLIPVLVGMFTRYKAPALAARIERAVSVFGAVVLLTLIIGISVSVVDQWAKILTTAGPAVVALSICGIVLGFLGSRLLGIYAVEAISVVVGMSVRNAAIGMLIAINMMNSPETAVPAALYGLLMYLFGFGLIGYGRMTIKSAV